jgi:hypothetical protein
MAPREYFKRQVFVSVEPEEAGGKYVIDYMGTDRKRIGSYARILSHSSLSSTITKLGMDPLARAGDARINAGQRIQA